MSPSSRRWAENTVSRAFQYSSPSPGLSEKHASKSWRDLQIQLLQKRLRQMKSNNYQSPRKKTSQKYAISPDKPHRSSKYLWKCNIRTSQLYIHATAGKISNSAGFLKFFYYSCIREVFLIQSEFDVERMTKKFSQTTVINYLRTSQNWIFFRQGENKFLTSESIFLKREPKGKNNKKIKHLIWYQTFFKILQVHFIQYRQV